MRQHRLFLIKYFKLNFKMESFKRKIYFCEILFDP